MQTPSVHSGPGCFFVAPSKHRRLKTFSQSRQTYKPSSLLTEVSVKSRKVSRDQLRVLYEKPTNGERKTRKKVCNNPVAYFRTLRPEQDTPELENLLTVELFGIDALSDECEQDDGKREEESMEIVNLKNSSINVSKIFGSNLLELSACKSDKDLDTTLHREAEIRPPCDDADGIQSLIDKLQDAIKTTKLDSRTRLKLQESVTAMRKTLASREVQLSRSFTKYLSNARPTLLYRN